MRSRSRQPRTSAAIPLPSARACAAPRPQGASRPRSSAASRPGTRRCPWEPCWTTWPSVERTFRADPRNSCYRDTEEGRPTMETIKPLFTIRATAVGGRNGHAETSDGLVKADLSVPKEMGGPGKAGAATPEHLFAVGYAACFGSSIDFVAKQKKRDAAKARVTCAVTIGPREGGGFGLAVLMRVEDKSIPQAELAAFVKEAHERVCPYSHAIRDNVEVAFEVMGS